MAQSLSSSSTPCRVRDLPAYRVCMCRSPLTASRTHSKRLPPAAGLDRKPESSIGQPSSSLRSSTPARQSKVQASSIRLDGGRVAEHLTDLATHFFTEIFNAGNCAFLEEMAREDIVYSDRAWMDRDIVGREKLRKYLEDLQRGYPDLQVHLDTVLSREDNGMVMVHWSARASNLGPFKGEAPTGRVSVWSGITMFVFDLGSRLQQVVVYRQPTEDERAEYFGWENMDM